MEINCPKVSVLTVNLNNKVGIVETIESVLNQTYDNKEYIVIDGGSTDGSIDVIRKYLSNINYWVSEPDGGIYDAMNKGIKVAKGKWIIFMNSGDKFINQNVLELIFGENRFNNTNIIYGNTLKKSTGELIISPSTINKYYFFFNTLCHQSIFTSLNSFKIIGNYNCDYKYVADRAWLLQAKNSSLNFKYLNITISEWDPEGASKENLVKFSKEIKKIQSKYFNFFEYSLMHLINYIRKMKNKLTQ